MAHLTTKDKVYLEKLFQMGGGYVLDFSDRTMGEFFKDNLGIDIYQDTYNYASGSKANHMRGFWSEASDQLVGRSINELIEYIESKILLDEFKVSDFKPELIDACKKIASRLLGGASQQLGNSVPDVEQFLHEDFENVSKALETLDPDVQKVMSQRLNEISAILTTAPLAAIFLIGSTLEGLLLDVAKRHASQFVGAKAAPRIKGQVKNLDAWVLKDLIEVAYELGYLTKTVREFSNTLRDFRNYIHPREQARANFYPTADTAKVCFQVLKAAVSELENA